jgi:hypothetical protein
MRCPGDQISITKQSGCIIRLYLVSFFVGWWMGGIACPKQGCRHIQRKIDDCGAGEGFNQISAWF